eukprot:199422-Pelagomonas_calceolata.AAC.1
MKKSYAGALATPASSSSAPVLCCMVIGNPERYTIPWRHHGECITCFENSKCAVTVIQHDNTSACDRCDQGGLQDEMHAVFICSCASALSSILKLALRMFSFLAEAT